MGLSKTCINISARLELGRFTTEMYIIMHIVKYLQRIFTFPNDNILKHAYMDNIELNQYNKIT